MSTVIKVTVEELPRRTRACSRHRDRLAAALVWTTYAAPYGGAAIRRTTYACPPCADRARAKGEWVREPLDDGTRFGTWYYVLGDDRWEVQRRTGREVGDDFGWYLFGPEVSVMGEFLGRRLGPSKAIAQDYVDDYPGARAWLRGDHYDDNHDTYKARAEEHWRR
jgi:hypothetical protein